MKKILALMMLSLTATAVFAEPLTLLCLGGVVYHCYKEGQRNDRQDSSIQNLTDSNNQLVGKVKEHDTKIDKLNDYCFPNGNGSI